MSSRAGRQVSLSADGDKSAIAGPCVDSPPAYLDRVFCKSSEAMTELPDDAVSLSVTSPPYWNAVDYDRHVKNPDQCYRTRKYSIGYGDYQEYLQWLSGISAEVHRVTKPGGFYCMVMGTLLLEGKHYPVPFDTASRLTSEGWAFHQDLVWHKVTGGIKRAGVFLQNPYPGYFYPNIMTEYILVLRKPGDPIYHDRTGEERELARVTTQRLFTNEIANTVWHIAPVPPGAIDHPCPFPEEIPHRLIQLYSYPGDIILDPFCGSGQTLKAARHLSRHYVGYDINEKYARLSERRVLEPSSVRPAQLVAAFDKIPTETERSEAGPRSPRTRYGKRKS